MALCTCAVKRCACAVKFNAFAGNAIIMEEVAQAADIVHHKPRRDLLEKVEFICEFPSRGVDWLARLEHNLLARF